MYGIYGGFTTIYHLIVRFPVLVMCMGIGGVTYQAITCPPPPPPPIIVPVIVKPIDPPAPVEVKPLPVKKIRGDSGSGVKLAKAD